jgi:hypothetical protein
MQGSGAINAYSDTKAVGSKKTAPFTIDKSAVCLYPIHGCPACGQVFLLQINDLPEEIHSSNQWFASMPRNFAS